MVAFLSPADDFRIWKENIHLVINAYFTQRGVEPIALSDLPDQPYRELYDDGVVPEAVAATILDDLLG